MTRFNQLDDTWAHAAFAEIPTAPEGARADLAGITRLGRASRRRQTQLRAAAGTGGFLAVAGVAAAVVTLIPGGSSPRHTTLVGSGEHLGGSSAAPSAPPVQAAPFCDVPGTNVPSHYLDWPCATPADATTPSLVAMALKGVLAEHSGIKDPKVRLLADTRTSTDPDTGPSVTAIEVWDAAGTGPAVIQDVTSKPGGVGGAPAPAGDPAFILGAALTTDNGVTGQNFYARANVTTIELEHDGAVTRATVTGGVASLMVKAGDPSIMHPSWRYVARDASGVTLATAPFDYVYSDLCDGKVSSTCTPIGTAPAATPRDSPVPIGAPPTEAPIASPTATDAPSTGALPTALASTQAPSPSPTP